MNEITANAASPTTANRVSPAPAAVNGRLSETAPPPASPSSRDEVELSERARLLSRLRETPAIREDVVDRVKSEIASGAYLTPDKIDRAADNLAADLDLFG
jgi:anti-sigma28 factor (negative regulator of flagellin synthesis)